MRAIKKISKKLLITILFISAFGYTNAQDKMEDQLIQGTWTFSDSPNTKWEFKDDGLCYDYLEGILLDTYSYTIIEQESDNGKSDKSVLKMVNTNNPDESYLYNIDKLNSGKLWLEYAIGFRDQYISFRRDETPAGAVTVK